MFGKSVSHVEFLQVQALVDDLNGQVCDAFGYVEKYRIFSTLEEIDSLCRKAMSIFQLPVDAENLLTQRCMALVKA